MGGELTALNGVQVPDFVGLIVGTVITLLIFSYLISDNALYRWALAILVGGGAGYALGVALNFIIWDWVPRTLGETQPVLRIFYFVPFLLGAMLLLKGFPPTRLLGRIAALGNISMGYLLGVGAAVAISGALLGSLFPLITATGEAVTLNNGLLGLLQGVVMLGGTVAALLVFSPRPRTRDGLVRPVQLWIHRVGRLFIIVALATVFANAITSGLTLWVERWSSVVNVVQTLMEGF